MTTKKTHMNSGELLARSTLADPVTPVDANQPRYVTRLIEPNNHPVGKQITLNPDGTLDSKSKVDVPVWVAYTFEVESIDHLAELIKVQALNEALILDYIPGTENLDHYWLVSERVMKSGFASPDQAPVHQLKKDNFVPSGVIVLDWDYDADRPQELQDATIEDFVVRMQRTVSALAEAGYLLTYSSKGRLLKADGTPAYSEPSGHVYMLTNNRRLVEVAGKVIEAKMWLTGQGYVKRGNTEQVLRRSPYDPATMRVSRRVFESEPVVSEGLTVAPRQIRLVPGPALDLGKISELTDEEKNIYRELTGQRIIVDSKGERITAYSEGEDLGLGAVLDTKDHGLMTLGEIVDMHQSVPTGDREHVRCQSIERDSDSYAAYVGWHRDGTPFVFDVGSHSKRSLCAADKGRLLFRSAMKNGHLVAQLPPPVGSVEPELDFMDGPAVGPVQVMSGAFIAAGEYEPGGEGPGAEEPHVDPNEKIRNDAARLIAEYRDLHDRDEKDRVALEIGKLAVLNHDMEWLRQRVKECNPETDDWLVDAYRQYAMYDFNRDHAVAMVAGKAHVLYREVNVSTGAMETVFSTNNSVAAIYQNVRLPSVGRLGGSKAFLVWRDKLFDTWMNMDDRRTYKQVTFMPQPDVIASTVMPAPYRGAYNLYAGAAFEPKPGVCERIKWHIYNTWCNKDDDVYWYVIKWMARMIQEPHKQGNAVIVLRSGEGGGKNIIISIFEDYFGKHAVQLTKPEDLTGFNDHLATSVFVFLNEAMWGGNKAAEGAVKSAITDKKLMVERKFVPKFEARNCTHIMVASNNDWVVPVGVGDRRFVMLDLNDEHKGNHAYFHALADEIDNGGKEAFIHVLRHGVDLTGFNAYDIPAQLDSVTKLDHKVRGMDSIEKWWLQVLTEGEFAFKSSIPSMPSGANIEWPEDGELRITRSDFYRSYEDFARSRFMEDNHSVKKKVTELLGLRVLRQTRPASAVEGGKRPVYFLLPPLTEARLAMEKRLKQHGPWRDVQEEGES